MSRRARKLLLKAVTPVIERASRSYIAGSSAEDAADCAQRLASTGRGITVGYWDGEDDTPESVFRLHLMALKAARDLDYYLSIKVTALDFREDLVAALYRQAGDVWLHCDAMDYELVERTREMIELVGPMGFTLPGRWARSEDDARWTSELGLPVRVVKGQWADPYHPDRDMTDGFLRVVERLAGRSAPVYVATHDPVLAEKSLRVLRKEGTPCVLELLFGLPDRPSIAMANRLGVPVRMYVPFGTAYLPYTLGVVRKKPQTLLWLLKDALTSPNRTPIRVLTPTPDYPRSRPLARSRTA